MQKLFYNVRDDNKIMEYLPVFDDSILNVSG